jgi:hypothetical protein
MAWEFFYLAGGRNKILLQIEFPSRGLGNRVFEPLLCAIMVLYRETTT